jgi:hypothetical protein
VERILEKAGMKAKLCVGSAALNAIPNVVKHAGGGFYGSFRINVVKNISAYAKESEKSYYAKKC